MESVSKIQNNDVEHGHVDVLRKLEEAIEFYQANLERHPIATLCRDGEVPIEVLKEFAKIQFVDSTLWVPMLSLIKGEIKEPRLIQAVRDNIMCESGCNGTPHTTMCKRFLESIGVKTFYGDYREYSPLSAHPTEVMNAIVNMTEPEMCGWLLVAETLVPTLFSIFRPAFARIPGADMTYLDEHIVVDSDEHAKWMMEGAERLIDRSNCYREILAGIDIGGRITLSIPDALYAMAVRMGKRRST